MEKKDFEKAKKQYDKLCRANRNFIDAMYELIGNDELPLSDGENNFISATIEGKYGYMEQVIINGVRVTRTIPNISLVEFHVIEIEGEEADEWMYGGNFIDDFVDLLVAALPNH